MKTTVKGPRALGSLLALAIFTVMSLAPVTSFAQTETGQITGTVEDSTGAIIANATVAVSNAETGLTRTVTTTSAGSYEAANLQPGTYKVVVSAQGFGNQQKTVQLSVGQRLGTDFVMQVGQTGTTITVAETGVTVNTETQTLGSTINGKEMVEFPSATRNPYDFVGTVGNVSPNDPSGRGVGYAINGLRASSTNVMLDGTANNDEYIAGIGQRVPLDSVQEYSVLTNNFTAEFGRAAGGVVNVVTKNGTNSFHGTAYEFNRLSRLATNDFDNNANGVPKSVFTRNQFGYSVGGPIIHNKLFFFNNTEWTRVRSAATTIVYVPTAQLIGASDAATQQFFSTFGTRRAGLQNLGTFTRGQLKASGFDPCKSGKTIQPLCAGLGADFPLFDRVTYSYPNDSGGGVPQNTYATVGRVDYNLTDKTQMYARYALQHELDASGTVSNSPYAGFDSLNSQVNNSVVFSVTHVFTPRLISQSKLDFNRFNNQQPFGGHGAVPTLYLGSASVATAILGNSVALPGYNPFTPGNGIPFGGPQNYIQAYQDFTYNVGKHSFRFGGTYTYLRDNRTFGAYETAVVALGNNFGRGLENFLKGQVYQYQAAVYPQGKYPCGTTPTPECTLTLPVGQPNFSRSNRYNDWGAYAQDSWKIVPRLTLNLGVRYEIFGTQHNKNQNLDSNFYLGSGSNIYEKIANGNVFTEPNSPIHKLWNTQYGNVAPRVGFAWDVFGDGKTSFRGGYGIGFERNFGNVTFNVIQNPPNYAVLSLFSGQDVPSIGISTDNAGPLSGSVGSKKLGKVSLRGVDPNIKTAYAHFYSAALEHRFGSSVVAAVEYSGSYGLDQYGIANINRAGTGPYYLGTPCTPGVSGDFGDCSGRLRATQYSNINYRTNGGYSDYNGLNFRLEVRNVANSGVSLTSNYTWSHAIDTLSDVFSSSANQVNLGWLDPFHPEVDKGDAYFDIRQRFTFGAVWEIPGHRSNAFTNYAFSGWTLAPLIVAQTGAPFSLYDCTNAATVCPYAMFTGAVPKSASSTTPTATPNKVVYLDVSSKVDSSFFNPKIGVSDFGPFPSNMIGRNFFRGPGSWNMDMGLYKSFRFAERASLQIRGEAYNLFNHANLYANVGDNDVSSISFVSASKSGRRQIQLGAKLIF